jgi:shikimate dehydrogenase
MTSRFCVVGSPIQHSLSPDIHQAAYSHLGLDFSYDRFEVKQGELAQFLDNSELSGLSVTMPLKQEAYSLASSWSPEASKTGVVNTLVRSQNGWVGHNTDVNGFINSFGGISRPSSVTLVGSGATSRSAALALSILFPDSEVSVLGRTDQSVEDLVELAKSFGLSARAEQVDAAALVNADLVVSTVPGSAFLDFWEDVASIAVKADSTLFDVAYDPWPSIAASSWGPKSISGLELLVWQAIAQVRLFAESKNCVIQANDSELYSVMKAAVTK